MAKYSVVDVKKIDIWISAKLFDGSLNHELVSMKKKVWFLPPLDEPYHPL